MKAKEYICYDNRTDDVLAIGTAKECARQLGIRVDSFHTQRTAFNHRDDPKYSKRNKHLDIYVIEDENESKDKR